jgi:hypothetical protein
MQDKMDWKAYYTMMGTLTEDVVDLVGLKFNAAEIAKINEAMAFLAGVSDSLLKALDIANAAEAIDVPDYTHEDRTNVDKPESKLFIWLKEEYPGIVDKYNWETDEDIDKYLEKRNGRDR